LAVQKNTNASNISFGIFDSDQKFREGRFVTSVPFKKAADFFALAALPQCIKRNTLSDWFVENTRLPMLCNSQKFSAFFAQ